MSNLFATLSLTLIAIALFETSACQDPGCIRNSECGATYNCIDSRCILIPTAANTAGSRASSAITLSDSGQSSSAPTITIDAGASQTTSPEAGATAGSGP